MVEELRKYMANENHQAHVVDKQSRVPNMLVAKAMDHALSQGTQRSLMSFKPKLALEPLAANEQRYLTPNAELPPQLRRGSRVGRACIDVEGEQPRLEAPKTMAGEDALHA